jgi:hypothetical protein
MFFFDDYYYYDDPYYDVPFYDYEEVVFFDDYYFYEPVVEIVYDYVVDIVYDLSPNYDLLVDDAFYLQANPDVAAAGLDADYHYANYGSFEGRDPNAYFDTTGYLTVYPDYDAWGWLEGRDPSTYWDTDLYLARNPDVAAAGINPLAHYLAYGRYEGRAFYDDGQFS